MTARFLTATPEIRTVAEIPSVLKLRLSIMTFWAVGRVANALILVSKLTKS
jgi:hypothetical protein